MDIFGIVLRENILMVLFGSLFIFLGLILMTRGWLLKIIGLFLFAGSAGWVVSLLLPQSFNLPGSNGSTSFIAGMVALVAGAFIIFRDRDESPRSFKGAKMPSVSKNTIIAGGLVAVVIFAAANVLLPRTWDNLFNFDNVAANAAANQTKNESLRMFNRLLREVDKAIAR